VAGFLIHVILRGSKDLLNRGIVDLDTDPSPRAQDDLPIANSLNPEEFIHSMNEQLSLLMG